MLQEILRWDIYEISSTHSNLDGIMLRGRIRKYALLEKVNLLTENASDETNRVRFALIEGTDASNIVKKIEEMISDSEVKLIKEKVPNPVLSKLKVNIENRYNL